MRGVCAWGMERASEWGGGEREGGRERERENESDVRESIIGRLHV